MTELYVETKLSVLSVDCQHLHNVYSSVSLFEYRSDSPRVVSVCVCSSRLRYSSGVWSKKLRARVGQLRNALSFYLPSLTVSVYGGAGEMWMWVGLWMFMYVWKWVCEGG